MDFEKEGQGLRCVRCPICRREFYPTTIWVWKIGDKRYCRYSCMRVDEKKLLAKKKETSRKSEEIAEARAARRAERMHNKYMEKKTGRQDCG